MEYSILNYVMSDGYSYESFLVNETGRNLPMPSETDAAIIQSDFDSKLSKADEQDCLIAAASGIVSSAIDILWVGEFDLKNAQEWGQKEVEGFVMNYAKSKGYSGDSLNGAIKKLEDLFPLPADAVKEYFGAGQHHLWDFTHHPSPLGLASSILSQFCRKSFGVNKDGVFEVVGLPSSASLGTDFAECVFKGTIVWAQHLISDMAGSSGSLGSGTGIPGPVISLIYEIAALPIFKSEDGKKAPLQTEISRLFNGVYFRDDPNSRGVKFDLRTEMGIAHEIGRMAVPVVINECLVRAFYSVKRLLLELKGLRASSLTGIKALNAKKILPFNSRPLTRMLTISSGVFMAIECSAAGVKAAAQLNGGKEKALATFFVSINYVGIGRFVVACKADSKYIAEDIRDAYAAFQEKQEQKRIASLQKALGVKQLLLSENQASILDSLKLQMVMYDISKTKSEKALAAKRKWKDEWLSICEVRAENSERGYSVASEIKRELAKSASCDWLRVVTLELTQFKPYFPLGSKQDAEFGKLKVTGDYLKDCYCLVQTSVSGKEIKALQKTLSDYYTTLSGSRRRIAVGVAATAAVTVVTMGAGWIFAPEIAVLVAGESFVGLSGAALTSASLAALGGGSIAAGGAGMAGGTAIIAGGGALLGAASSGAASLASTMALSSKAFTLSECAKLLAFCKIVLVEHNSDKKAVAEIRSIVEAGIIELDEIIARGRSIKKPTKEQKDALGEQKASLRYLKRCSQQLEKMIQP